MEALERMLVVPVGVGLNKQRGRDEAWLCGRVGWVLRMTRW
jgi:hypothetical protein